MWKKFTELCKTQWDGFCSACDIAWSAFWTALKEDVVNFLIEVATLIENLIKAIFKGLGLLATAVLGGLLALILDGLKWCFDKVVAWIEKI